MSKARLLLSLVFGFSLCTQAVTSSEDHITSFDARPITGSFMYQKELFEFFQTSDIMSDSPALEDLRTDALVRLTHLSSLFDFVRQNGMNKHTQNLFKKDTKVENAHRERFLVPTVGAHQKVTTCLDPRLIILSKLKTDYAVERDLVSYFSKCLESFSQDRPSLEQIQNLYEQSAYVVRLNMQSLLEKMFNHMMRAYPKNFIRMGDCRDKMSVLQDGLSVFGEEDTLYYDYFKTYAGTDFSRENTVNITKRVRSFLTGVPLSDPGVIYELNSIFFYLNMERSLLSFCPDLEFVPENYPLDTRRRGVQADRFILSKLIETHEGGFLANLLSETYVDQKKSQLYLSAKMVSTVLSTSAEKEINLFLYKIFPVEKRVQSAQSSDPRKEKKKPASTPKSRKQSTSKGKARSKKLPGTRAVHDNTSQKKIIQESSSSSSESLPVKKEFLETKDTQAALFSDFEDTLPQLVQDFEGSFEERDSLDSGEDVQDEDLLSFQSAVRGARTTMASTSTSLTPAPRARLPKAPYRAHLTYDDYIFQRCISTRPAPTYVFNGKNYSFRVRPFNLENLREIKALTHHTSGRLPNVASYTLRFHMHDGVGDFYQEFAPQDLYLSGGHYFDRERDRLNLHVQNAYHTVLDQSQQDHFRQTEPKKRGLYLGKILEKEVREHVVGGAWKDNCVDSEAILLLDLVKRMPNYLKTLAKAGSQDMEIRAVSLGIATYYDVCWRCRNLLQGWQWGLKDLITHVRPSMKISPDFSTLVMGFGEVRPESHGVDLHPPRFFEDSVVLGAGKPHKLASVNMRRGK